MKIARTKLAEVIGEKTLHITDSQPLAKAIAAYLLEQGREHELEPLMRDIVAYRETHGVVEAVVTSAHSLGQDVTNRVKALLKEHYPEAEHILVRNQSDPAVVGGLVVSLPHEQLDLSVRTKLGQFKRLITGGNLS